MDSELQLRIYCELIHQSLLRKTRMRENIRFYIISLNLPEVIMSVEISLSNKQVN